MHFHHTNPKWQMPKQCEVYLEKIQERGKNILFLSFNIFHILFSCGRYANIINTSTII